ncbi:MAG: PEGA domain-containing protein [Candidatus Aminicenantes bacterium]|nr:PEGA domain-containing protein [Candidatus Aminicenantes bacterium]
MKNISLISAVLFFIMVSAACSINVPWDIMNDYDGVRVVMRVNPDDADVLLNGRLIGAAYEFSSSTFALRLASRQNELVFKKRGFREEAIDLRSYSSRNITLKIILEREDIMDAAEPAVKKVSAVEEQQAYEAKTEPLPAQPAVKQIAAEERSLTQVTLSVTPEETAIYIDGKFWGLAPAEGKTASLRLPPGKYIFAAFKPGFSIYKKEITVPKQDEFILAIALQK